VVKHADPAMVAVTSSVIPLNPCGAWISANSNVACQDAIWKKRAKSSSGTRVS
jgi:hypothetical protein